MRRSILALRAALATLAAAPLASAAPAGASAPPAPCADGSCYAGGGKAETDCFSELDRVHPNTPFPVPGSTKNKPKNEQRCFDGDAGCDLDGEVNGVCRFPVDVCLANTDPNLPACAPAEVRKAPVRAKGSADKGAALQNAVDALLPAAAPACTAGQTIDVPLEVKRNGEQRERRVKLKVKAATPEGKDSDTLRLTCVPRLWPSHGYDHYNRRATTRSAITSQNVANLVRKWKFDTPGAVTSTPTVGEELVYTTSWDGVVYAIDREDGTLAWSYDTLAPGALQSGATLTPEGRLLVGDPEARVHCLDAETGALLWMRNLELLPQDHVWGSPTVVNDRVLVPIASDGDTPCTKGRLVALELDTGAPIWTARTAPDRVCEDESTRGCTIDTDCTTGRCVGMCAGDRGIACQDDADCSGAGPCEDAVGGGITATPATDVTGETVFAASVGCYTGPRIGNSDRFFRIRASDGSIEWALPDFPPEAFGNPPFNDYGFLNGPIVVSGPTPALIGASKDGKLYARDPATGGELWTTVVQDVTTFPLAFAGFGLFNGAPAFANGRVFTSLYGFGGGAPQPPGIAHSQAFAAGDGMHVWDAELDVEPTFGHVSLANDVVFVGSSDFFQPTGEPAFYAFDAANGDFLAKFDLPTETPSAAASVGGEVYIGFGAILGAGGVVAFELP
jgi:outer membrane protein assembly factor BamB